MSFPALFLILALVSARMARAQEASPSGQVPSAPAQSAPAPTGGAAAQDSPGSSDYEIDYEEEPESGDESADEPEPEKPAKQSPKKKLPSKKNPAVDRNAPTSQGTRSKNKFAPMLKSDTKSLYKKNGKFLDVDTD